MCETGLINRKNEFKDDDKLGRTLPNPQEEYILAATKNLSTSLEILEGPKFPELQKYFPCQSTKEAKKLGTTSDGERSLKP